MSSSVSQHRPEMEIKKASKQTRVTGCLEAFLIRAAANIHSGAFILS